MKVPFVDLRRQYLSIKEEIDNAIKEVIDNTAFIRGSAVFEFEEQFATFNNSEHCISCANGTDALEIVLQALEIGPGDEVIVPANSWFSTSEVVNSIGAEPVFVDVLNTEYTIDITKIEEKINGKTKAIIPVHLYGLPAHMKQIIEIAEKHNLYIIEDCAQAHDAGIGGVKTGNFGIAGTFSFYPGKNLGAYGDAGAIVTSDSNLAEKCRMIGNHGQLKKHHHRMIGRNSRLDTIQAAILSIKLKYLRKWTDMRIENADYYRQLLSKASSITIPEVPEEFRHVYHLFVIQQPVREELIDFFNKKGISFGIHYPTPLPFLEAYSYKNHSTSEFPVSAASADKIISLPMFAELEKQEIEKVCDTILELNG